MGHSGVGVTRRTAGDQPARAGAEPSTPLHFHTGKVGEASALVMEFHYSRRPPANIQFVGSWHEDGGLFGDQGRCVAAAFFSIPPTRWREPVIELSRLVRRDDVEINLSGLLSICYGHLKKRGADLLVSFADTNQGHHGGIYKASGWEYFGLRDGGNDGLVIDGIFRPARSCYSAYGTWSLEKVRRILPHSKVEYHYCDGKHLFWKALGRRGLRKAERLGLA